MAAQVNFMKNVILYLSDISNFIYYVVINHHIEMDVIYILLVYICCSCCL